MPAQCILYNLMEKFLKKGTNWLVCVLAFNKSSWIHSCNQKPTPNIEP